MLSYVICPAATLDGKFVALASFFIILDLPDGSGAGVLVCFYRAPVPGLF